MRINQLTSKNDSANSKDAKPSGKKGKSQLVRVTIEEINAIRPSVYKYLLP
jgi:hypothetical protein